jgi:hypothetical protein
MRAFDKDHLTFLKALNKYFVKYIIIGGHASIYYGVNRNTGDLDVLIEPSVANGHRLLAVLKSLKLEVPEIVDEEWTRPLVLSFGFEPDAIDILNYTPGVIFEEVFDHAIKITQQGVLISIIDIRDLIVNKQALNRKGEKSFLDKYDIEVLKKIIDKKK